MRITAMALAPVLAMLLPVAAFAQTGDVQYCKALADKYEKYLDMSSKRGMQPQSAESRVGMEKCKAGDTSGIPSLEKALQNAKLDLPPRT